MPENSGLNKITEMPGGSKIVILVKGILSNPAGFIQQVGEKAGRKLTMLNFEYHNGDTAIVLVVEPTDD